MLKDQLVVYRIHPESLDLLSLLVESAAHFFALATLRRFAIVCANVCLLLQKLQFKGN